MYAKMWILAFWITLMVWFCAYQYEQSQTLIITLDPIVVTPENNNNNNNKGVQNGADRYNVKDGDAAT